MRSVALVGRLLVSGSRSNQELCAYKGDVRAVRGILSLCDLHSRCGELWVDKELVVEERGDGSAVPWGSVTSAKDCQSWMSRQAHF